MKKILIAVAVATLTGCVTSATLIAQDGPHYTMHVNKFKKALSADIDGIAFTGTYVIDQAVGFGVSQSFGMRPITASNSIVVQGGSIRAILTSATGGYIECFINQGGGAAVGRCLSNKGRQFVLTTN